MPEPKRSDLFVWLDIETFGLVPRRDPILELGIRITDLDLNTIAAFQSTVWGVGHDNRYAVMEKNPKDEFVRNLHTDNDLFVDAKINGGLTQSVEEEAIKWLVRYDSDDLPMCGSSIHTDRAFLKLQMPELEAAFHYRNIDISTIKEVCKRYNPKVWEKLPAQTSEHRVDQCLDDTIAEFKFYRDEFLLW